jgi:hypothetical protein
MIKSLTIVALIIATLYSHASAQMGHGMMRGGHMTDEGHTEGAMGRGQMMDHDEMMSMMTEMTGQITEMLQEIRRKFTESLR